MGRKYEGRDAAVSAAQRKAASKRLDDIFEGELAARWINAMRTYGDPIRASIVNPIVAFVADYFTASPLYPGGRAPRNLIQQALQKVSDELGRATYRKNDEPLHGWHADTKRLATLYPHLKESVVWDLGCGEGYLGRWLDTLGGKGLGVEPSEMLSKHAAAKAAATMPVFRETIDGFLKRRAAQCLDSKPTLLTLISVLDGCADADRTLDRINTFMRKHSLEVPLLLATLDPDFFCAGLPRSPVNSGIIRWFGQSHEFTMRDPAEWELSFVEHNYHVLDQRPIHLDTLPSNLTRYVLDLCREQIRFDADPVDLIAPRQGPFYFWIIAPRPRINGRPAHVPPPNAPLSKETVAFKRGEIIEVRANLGSKVYQMIDGSAHLDYAGLFEMTFSKGMFFGQLETSQNYFASRMLGPIVALEDVVAQSFPLSKVADQAESADFPSRLFLSLISHMDSLSYTRLFNSKHVRDGKRSSVLPSAPVTNVRNCSAVLLNLCAKNCPSRAQGYKARMLIELTYEELQKTIYHDVLKRRNTGLMKTLGLLVQCSIVDCFSTNSLALFRHEGGVQDDISEVDENKLAHGQFLHVGLIVVHYLRKVIGEPAATLDVRTNAIAISAFLGSKGDQAHLKYIVKEFAAAERRNQEQQLERGRRTRIRSNSVRTAPDRLRFVVENIESELEECSPDLRGSIERFLGKLRAEFDFHDKKPYATSGFSKFIVVRDVWALLACTMNDEDIWMREQRQVTMNVFVKNPQQRHRLIAYFYECVAHVGSRCGLAS
jgi:hypothetical protein